MKLNLLLITLAFGYQTTTAQIKQNPIEQNPIEQNPIEQNPIEENPITSIYPFRGFELKPASEGVYAREIPSYDNTYSYILFRDGNINFFYDFNIFQIGSDDKIKLTFKKDSNSTPVVTIHDFSMGNVPYSITSGVKDGSTLEISYIDREDLPPLPVANFTFYKMNLEIEGPNEIKCEDNTRKNYSLKSQLLNLIYRADWTHNGFVNNNNTRSSVTTPNQEHILQLRATQFPPNSINAVPTFYNFKIESEAKTKNVTLAPFKTNWEINEVTSMCGSIGELKTFTFTETINTNYITKTFSISDTTVAEIVSVNGNQVTVRSKKPGSFKFIIESRNNCTQTHTFTSGPITVGKPDFHVYSNNLPEAANYVSGDIVFTYGVDQILTNTDWIQTSGNGFLNKVSNYVGRGSGNSNNWQLTGTAISTNLCGTTSVNFGMTPNACDPVPKFTVNKLTDELILHKIYPCNSFTNTEFTSNNSINSNIVSEIYDYNNNLIGTYNGAKISIKNLKRNSYIIKTTIDGIPHVTRFTK